MEDYVREAELARMMDAYSSALTGLCAALLKDGHLAQDVVQETFVKAWYRMDQLRGGRQSEKAWLCRIAINLCRDLQRTRWLRLVDKQAEPETLGQLKSKYREVITLHYLENMSAEEIGQAAGLSASAVYRRLKKAKTQLRQLLEGGENDG